MSKARKKKPAPKSFFDKIGDTLSHVKDAVVEKKDDLVDAVEDKVAAFKEALQERKDRSFLSWSASL
ncbi:MAG: hypothetical protein EOO01_36010, partial [Chitinophagaceae bacterium]